MVIITNHSPFFLCQFFLKATQLEQMSTDYELIIEQQDIIKSTLERKQEVCVDTVSPQNKIMIFILKVTTYYSDY